MTENGLQWNSIMRRQRDYAAMMQSAPFKHLEQDPSYLTYAIQFEVEAGLKIGIAGLNSAWSSRGIGKAEVGQLWCGAERQAKEAFAKVKTADVRIALIHRVLSVSVRRCAAGPVYPRLSL